MRLLAENRLKIAVVALIASLTLTFSQALVFAGPPSPNGNVPCRLAVSNTFLLPTWYEYIKTGRTDANSPPKCTIPDVQLTNAAGTFDGTGILLILLAIVDILLRLAGIVALGFIVYSGIRFVMSQGSPDKTKQAQSTLLDAVIGLVIALVAVAIVSFIGHSIG